MPAAAPRCDHGYRVVRFWNNDVLGNLEGVLETVMRELETLHLTRTLSAPGGGEGAMSDLAPMKAALALARRGLGSVWPNPAVGCVLVKEGRGGRARLDPAGRAAARRDRGAGSARARAARGATAYVSLEPCCHWGKTPPCADALIAAGVARVVVPIEDPDPRVSGKGIAQLRDAGIAVDTGLCAEEAAEINAGFFLRLTEGRPLVTLKLATTLDGRIATADGRKPLDHRRARARPRPSAARHPRRGHGRQQHA